MAAAMADSDLSQRRAALVITPEEDALIRAESGDMTTLDKRHAFGALIVVHEDE
jgi:hypothetical protein